MPGLTTVDHANSQAQTAAAYERVTAAAVAELHDAMAAGAAQDGLSIEERIDFAVRSARRASRQHRSRPKLARRRHPAGAPDRAAAPAALGAAAATTDPRRSATDATFVTGRAGS